MSPLTLKKVTPSVKLTNIFLELFFLNRHSLITLETEVTPSVCKSVASDHRDLVISDKVS